MRISMSLVCRLCRVITIPAMNSKNRRIYTLNWFQVKDIREIISEIRFQQMLYILP